jgi:membrane fusion protein, multidrug efflux system
MLSEQANAEPSRVSAPPRRRSWWPTALWLAGAAAAGTAYSLDPRIVERAVALIRPEPPQAKAVVPRVVPVTVAAARQADLDLYLNGLGAVVAYNTVTIRSRVEGQLLKVAFQEGQTVEEGDLLAEIDPRPYEVQLTQAEGALARGEAALRTAQRDLERYESLADLRQITEQQIDAQRTLVQQCEAAIKIDRGVIDNVRLQLDYCRITAPITGRIGLRLVDAGNIVRANDAAGLAVIAQFHPIAVVFTVPQDEIVRVQRALATNGKLSVDAYNRDFQAKLASGSLTALDNQVDSSTGTVKLKAVFPNEDNTLFPNQFVNARLLVETIRDATVIPMAAVQHGPKSTFVYVVQPDSTVELRPVITGATQGDQVNIVSGLVPDELVVTTGIDKLHNKAKVAVRGAPAKTSDQGAG